MKESRLEALPCPLCRGSLAPIKGRHGLVWVCRTCRAGAATLPILREVAPRAFVNSLWQAALHEGRRSALLCPSCTKPFTEFTGAPITRQIKVCVRCYWVWLSARATSALTTRAIPAAQTHALVRRTQPLDALPAPGQARQVLGSLTAGVLVRALSSEPRDE